MSERIRVLVSEGTRQRESIRTAALELGFTSVGFAPAEPPAHAQAYLAWLDAGHHADMNWMAREDAVRRRLDPREALSGCQTLIVALLLPLLLRRRWQSAGFLTAMAGVPAIAWLA